MRGARGARAAAGGAGRALLSTTAPSRCALCRPTTVTRTAAPAAAAGHGGGTRGTPAPDPSSFYSADVPLTDEARAWFAEKEPKPSASHGSGAAAAPHHRDPDIPGPGEPLGPTDDDHEPLYPGDPHRRRHRRGDKEGDGEQPDPDFVKRDAAGRRSREPLETQPQQPAGGALPREGEPRALSTDEYWRGDTGSRAPEPATARPESTGDAGYQ
jgi:hypothetical protein